MSSFLFFFRKKKRPKFCDEKKSLRKKEIENNYGHTGDGEIDSRKKSL